MTSTDGFFARRKPDPADIGSYLGGLTVERGHLTIWRERLYAFRVHGKVAKFALHGFRGGLEKLLKVPLRAGVYGYTAQQMMTLKLSIRDHRSSRYQAGMFAELPFELRIAGEPSGP